MTERIFGIDISRWQRGISLEKAKSEGASFVLIKASQNDFTDPEFEVHYKACKNLGISVGAYHYLAAESEEAAIREADYFAKVLSGKVFDYPVFVDVEEEGQAALGKAKLTSVVSAFCERMEQKGFWCGVYCNYDFYKNKLNGEALAKRFSLWLASWSKSCPADCQIWQFGGETNLLRSNSVAGMVCDQNYCFVDYPTMIRKKGLNGMKNDESPSPKPASTVSTKPAVTFKVGDRVKLKANAVIYGTKDRFASFVYTSPLYLRELNGNRAVVSTLREGAVTGAVDVSYLTK